MKEPVQLEYSTRGEARALSSRCVAALVVGLCGGPAAWAGGILLASIRGLFVAAVFWFLSCHFVPVLFCRRAMWWMEYRRVDLRGYEAARVGIIASVLWIAVSFMILVYLANQLA
jgi:hypothetical protein